MTEQVLPSQEKLIGIFRKYELVSVYLFGSRADGTASSESDYDFALLFKDAPGIDDAVLLEMNIADEVKKVVGADVDILVLNSASIEMRFLVFKRGVLVYSADDELRTDFEEIIIRDYLDFKPFLDTFRKEVREAIKGGGFYA
jgi:predicted nucleotidyltransferase